MSSEEAPDLPQNLKEIDVDDDCQEGQRGADLSPIVTINVGGMLFSTHSATLQKVRREKYRKHVQP